jgi:hypothetical protein
MRSFFVLMLVLVATATVTGGVAAQENVTVGNDTNVSVDAGADEPRCTETVSEELSICSAELDGNAAVLELQSDGVQRITLTEAMQQTGELSRQDFLLTDGRNTVRLQLSQEADGDIGVTIDTGDVLYGKIIEHDSALIGGPWSSSDAQAAALGGALSVSITTLWLVIRRLRGRDMTPERVA